MIRQILPDLFEIKIRLVGNPLKNLNCYVFTSEDRNLLIDTGFNQPECLEDLLTGIREIGLDMAKTDLFITHFHSDHCGLMDQVATKDSRIFMSRVDKDMLEHHLREPEASWQDYQKLYLEEGYPAEDLKAVLQSNPARSLASTTLVPISPLEDGDTLVVGDRTLTCILTPGHTPGHMCLYDEANRIMVLGDHVLFDISPNITAWPSMPNALTFYLESLAQIKAYPVDLPLPAHRAHSITMHQRIDELLAHHENRLNETLLIIRQRPGINAYDLAGHMTWSIRARNWEEFPASQKWFAIGETIAHLYHLRDQRKLRRTLKNGVAQYEVVS